MLNNAETRGLKQVSIVRIELLTHLNFGNLHEHNPIPNVEATIGRLSLM